MEEEKWIPLMRGTDGCFITVYEPKRSIWYEHERNSHRFKMVCGATFYLDNGEDKKPIDKKQQLLTSLQALQSDKDHERAGSIAQDLLLSYIGDKDITEAYNKINKY